MNVRQIVPDTKTLGDVTATLYAAMYPMAPETAHGPYSLSALTDVRLTGRQVRVRVDQVGQNWRLGSPRLDVVPAGRR